MIGIIVFVIGALIGVLLDWWIEDIIDSIKWRKFFNEWESFLDGYSPTKWSYGDMKWTGYQLEIKGKLK
jgi:ABC-type lipoprotein release transport system permease subunit